MRRSATPLAEVAEAVFPGQALESVEGGDLGSHAVVRRARLWEAARATAVVVKEYPEAGEAWQRETAALQLVGDDVTAPRLHGASARPPVAVITDLGEGGNLADALLGSDATLAAERVGQWAEAIGRLHARTAGRRSDFASLLAARSGDGDAATHTMPGVLADAAASLEGLAEEVGARVEASWFAEMRALGDVLSDQAHSALSPADACPDNNVMTETGLVLIDFEGAEFRHVAWDLAYLLVPWPTCWCSWRLPDDVVSAALDRYRALVAGSLPYVSGTSFAGDLARARLGWSLISTAMFHRRALDGDPPATDAVAVPTRRAAIVHRLATAGGGLEDSPLAALAQALNEALTARWGHRDLALAPAFR